MTDVDDFGTILYRSTTSASAGYVSIGEVTKISPPEIKVEKVNFTNHASTKGYRVYKPSKQKELSEFSFTLNVTGSALLTGFLTDMEDQSVDYWKLAFPTTSSSSILAFSGFITSYKLSDADSQSVKPLTVDLKVQPTDVPTWASTVEA